MDMQEHDIYESESAYAPYVTMTLQPGARLVADPGAMMFKDAQIEVREVDGVRGRGFLKRLFRRSSPSGPVAFVNTGSRAGVVALEPPNNGVAVSLSLDAFPQVIAMRDAFLAATTQVQFADDGGYRRIGLPKAERGRGHKLFLSALTGRVFQRRLAQDDVIDLYPSGVLAMTPEVRVASPKVESAIVRHLNADPFKVRHYTRLSGPGTVWLHTSTLAYAGDPAQTLGSGLEFTMRGIAP